MIGTLSPVLMVALLSLASRSIAPPACSCAAVPVKNVLLPDLIATLTLLQRSVALPAKEAPGTGDWLHVPGLRLKDVAATLPVFCRVMLVVWAGPPATSGVLVPPYLLIVEQVAEFVVAPAPSVLLQV